MCRKREKDKNKPYYVIQNSIQRLFLPWSCLAIIGCGILTIFDLFYHKRERLIEQAVEFSILLSLEIVA